MLETSMRSMIIDQIRFVARQQDKILVPLNDTVQLLNSGLDSLCIAIIVANLDDALGLDPLSDQFDVKFPVTVGDFIDLYEHSPA